MNLKDFVTQTLIDVVEGVAGAQEAHGQGRGAISPAQGPHNPYQNIDFDLAIVADDSGDKGAISVARADNEPVPRGQRTEVSRIQFTVPVRLPTKSP